MSLRNIQVIPGLPYNVKPIIDITDTLPNRKPDPEPIRAPEQITHISVHHSAVEGGTIQGYADYHVNTLKWAHIGYHLVIKGDQIYQTNDLLTFSYHTSSNNGYTVGVSVSGDLSKRGLTDDERNCLYAAILTMMAQFNIPVQNVLGHREYPANNTSCPCLDMNKLREDIRNLQAITQRNGSWQKKIENISFMGGQFKYLNSKVSQGEKDGDAQWAASVYMDIYDYMKSKHYL